MRRERLSRGRYIRFLRLFSLFILVAFIWIAVSGKFSSQTLISPLSSSALTSDLPVQDSKDAQVLGASIKEVLKDSKGEYSVVVSNLKTGESFSMNEHKEFDAGSLYKLWVMGGAYEQIQLGVWKDETFLSEEVLVLNDKFNLASESAELKEGKIELSVGTALQRMITISDNYSALLLTWKMRLSKVASFMSAKGFFESKLGTTNDLPTTTAYDIALFFERLYKGQLANKESTEQMVDLLKGQRLNGKIPKLLPEKTVIAHKTGELGLVTHDAGIVYHPKGDYIIVLMSQSPRPKDAEEKIAQVSKVVFDYFDKK